MANFLQTGGPTVLLATTAGSTVAVGAWWQVHGSLGRLAFQTVLQTASAGATAGTTVVIEVTNSTALGAMATRPLSMAPIATTDLVSDGGVFATSMQGQWSFIRANMLSLTTSTAGSAGGPTVTVIVGAGMTGQM